MTKKIRLDPNEEFEEFLDDLLMVDFNNRHEESAYK